MKRKRTRRDIHSGSSLDDLLKEDGILAEVEAVAIKRVIALQLQRTMRQRRITKSAMAEKLGTSRSQLDRLLDPENASVQLDTITRAARAVGKQIRIEMVDSR